MHSFQTEIHIKLFNTTHLCYLVKTLKCKSLVVELIECLFHNERDYAKKSGICSRYFIASSEYLLQHG